MDQLSIIVGSFFSGYPLAGRAGISSDTDKITRRPNATVLLLPLVVPVVGKTKMIATNLKLDNDQIRQTMQSLPYLAAFLGQHNKGCKSGSDAETALGGNR